MFSFAEVGEQVLKLRDVEGNKWYFKSDSIKATSLWQWKIEMAMQPDINTDDTLAESLQETRRRQVSVFSAHDQ